MTKKELKLKIKEEQKSLAQKIKRCRPLRKPDNYHKAPEKLQQECSGWAAVSWSWKYRHMHIIYCNMFNNTPYDRIEQPRDGNSPSSHMLDKIRKEWEDQIDEEALYNRA